MKGLHRNGRLATTCVNFSLSRRADAANRFRRNSLLGNVCCGVCLVVRVYILNLVLKKGCEGGTFIFYCHRLPLGLPASMDGLALEIDCFISEVFLGVCTPDADAQESWDDVCSSFLSPTFRPSFFPLFGRESTDAGQEQFLRL